MINSIKSTLRRNIINARGWRTNHKLIAFESDDWGSIRMPNQEVYKSYSDLGYDLSSSPYCKYDTMANSADLEALYSVLVKYIDERGNNPIITFNTVVGNPDFQKIKKSDFAHYFFEPFTDTLERYYPKEKVFNLWDEGISKGLIRPQFHGREHVNVPIWMEFLKSENKPLREAFNLGFWGVPQKLYTSSNNNIQASYESAEIKHIDMYKQTVKEGLHLFEDIFKFKSITFIANNFIWPMELNEELFKMGVVGLQGMHYQKIPKEGDIKELHEIFTGKKSEYNQIYTMRNCTFEPAQTPDNFDDIGNCLKEIKTAFLWKKPAIINVHRLNFIGALDEKNRRDNLIRFNTLLRGILKQWPDVQFLSSDKLIDLILKG